MLYKKIIVAYHEYCEKRVEDMKFIYQTLTWTNKTVSIEIFLKFLSILSGGEEWYARIMQEMVNILQYEKDYENGLSKSTFMRIIKKCP